MVDPTPALEMFEKKSKRILWLPGLTLGYIYHLSGVLPDFMLAVVGIAGGRYFLDLINSSLVDDEDLRLRDDATAIFRNANPILTNTAFAVISALYVVAAVYSAYRLEQIFVYTDLVLVGLALVYWSAALIIILPSSRTSTDTVSGEA